MNKKEKVKFVKNSILQLQKIEKQAVAEAKRTFRQIKRLLKDDFNNLEFVKPFLIEKLKPLFNKTLFASYLLGQRRTVVSYEKNEGETLRLSIIDDMANYLSNLYSVTEGNTLINIDELQDLIDTRSLRILNDVSSDIELQLREKINDLITRGYHNKDAIKELNKELNNLGISDTNDFQLETIFRTQTQMAYSAGGFQAIQNNEYLRDAIQMYEFSAVMDNRTTQICEDIDGTRLPADDPFWHTYYPPLHFNCRSVCVSIFEEEDIVKPPQSLDQPQLDFNPAELF